MNKKIQLIVAIIIYTPMVAEFKEEELKKPWVQKAKQYAEDINLRTTKEELENHRKWFLETMQKEGLVEVMPVEQSEMRRAGYPIYRGYSSKNPDTDSRSYWIYAKHRQEYRNKPIEERIQFQEGYTSKAIKVPSAVAKEIDTKRELEGHRKNSASYDGAFFVSQEDYNKYYYNQLPWYKRWFSGLFTQKPSSSSSSGVLKSYASVSLPTTQTRQRSRITIPKYIAPTMQKTMERAKKLEKPYISTPPSAAKALKQSERFGIGYQ